MNTVIPVVLISIVLVVSFPDYSFLTWLIFALFALHGAVSLQFFRRGMVDAVKDEGAALLVLDRWQRDRIPLSEIKSLYVSEGTNPATATIRLRESSMFGYEISFALAAPFFPINRHVAQRLKRLQRRLDQINVRRGKTEEAAS